MIQVTLTFHSLSAALHALREIPESTLNGALTDITPAEETPAKPAPKREKPRLQAVAEVTTTPAPTVVATPAPSVDYPALQRVVLQLAARDRDAAAGIAGSLGVKSFKELESARWGEAFGAVTAKLAELETVQ
jgi:hypothetical protein